MLIDQKIKEQVSVLDKIIYSGGEIDTELLVLIKLLRQNLEKTEVKKRYLEYITSFKGGVGKYPVLSDSYAKSYDPLEEEGELWGAWEKFGVVVVKNVATGSDCEKLVERMDGIVKELSNGESDLNKSETWKKLPKDENEVPFISRGFFEMYHDKNISEIRQSLRLYLAHVIIWGRVDLWVSFDRLGLKLPKDDDSKALPLHVDQNPTVHPNFKTTQGVLALVDCPLEIGTFACVPGSKSEFKKYSEFIKNSGEYVELPLESDLAKELKNGLQAFPLKKGSIVIWDSRTTHANTENISDKTRYVAYISMGPSQEKNPDLVEQRKKFFQSGEGVNLREALMHASKKMRYSQNDSREEVREQEVLNKLGRLLYGFEKYE